MKKFVVAWFLLGAAAAVAQPVRTFVAVEGFDSNPCTPAAPCRSFDVALAAVATNGEIVVLSSGGYGPVVIDKGVKIRAPKSVHAAIAPTVGAAITVNAGTASVFLDGLHLNGQGGSYGLSIQAAGSVVFRHSSADSFQQHGVWVNAAAMTFLSVEKSSFRINLGAGVELTSPASSPAIYAVVTDSTFVNNGTGMIVRDASRGVIRKSFVADHVYGLAANASVGSTAILDVEGCVMMRNGYSVRAGGIGGTSTIRVSNSTIVFSRNLGASTLSGGTVLTRINNTYQDNVAGAFTGTFTAK